MVRLGLESLKVECIVDNVDDGHYTMFRMANDRIVTPEAPYTGSTSSSNKWLLEELIQCIIAKIKLRKLVDIFSIALMRKTR